MPANDKEPSGDNPAMGATAEMRQRLGAVATQLGSDLDEGRIVPKLQIDRPVSEVGRQLGQILSRCAFFVQGDGRVVKVDEIDGRIERMSPEKIGAAAEDYVTTTVYKYGTVVPSTMCEAVAKRVLASRQFRDALWPLRAVHPVRMPLLRAKENRVELPEKGYDEQAKIYTADTVPYRKDVGIEEAQGIFKSYLKDYPFAHLKETGFFRNRSVAVQVALMVGTYIRGFFEAGDVRPIGFYNGNQPGTGKGTLCLMNLIPVYGLPRTGRKPRDEAEFEKRLDSAALGFDPYLILDDIGGALFSQALNAWITEPVHSGRIFGTQDTYEAENVTQVFATGNAIKTTRDIERRSLIVELHLAGDIEGRKFGKTITPKYLATEKVRAELLSALWALVKNWGDLGCPRPENGKSTFENWTEIVAGIVRCGGFSDPLEAPELIMGGDEEGQAWKAFLARLAGEFIDDVGETRNFTTTECLEAAKKWEQDPEAGFSLDDLVGSARDPAKAFGQRIAKWRGREIIDTRGRKVQFGSLRQAKKRVYPCQVLSGPGSDRA